MNIKSEKGNTLLQALVAVAITAIITINMISVFSMMSKSNNTLNAYQQIQSTLDEARLVLSKTELCTLNLKDKVLNTTGTFPIEQTSTAWTTDLSVLPPGSTTGTLGATGSEILKDGKSLGNGVFIDELKVLLTGVTGTTYYAKLRIKFKSSANSVAGPSEINRDLPLRFETVNSGGIKVAACGAQPELTMGCKTELKLFGVGVGLDTLPASAREVKCTSASAEITSCDTISYNSGILTCGTSIIPRNGSAPPYCNAGACTVIASPPYPAGQQWGTTITCCETGGPVPPPPPTPLGTTISTKCHRVVAANSVKGPCGFTSQVSCPAGEYLLSGGTTGGKNVSMQNSGALLSGSVATGWAVVFINSPGAGVGACDINCKSNGTVSDAAGCFDISPGTCPGASNTYQLCGLAEAICCHD